MKFSIRIKFFVVLLAFSLGPIFLSRSLMGKASQRMSEDLGDQTRSELNDIVSAELEANAVSLAEMVSAQGTSMALAARMLSMEASRVLNPVVPPSDLELFFADDFRRGDFGPPDLASGDLYHRKTHHDGPRALEVSFKHPTFLFAPGSSAESMFQARQLRNIQPALHGLYKELGAEPYWFNVGLESGVYMTYPGHGGFPMMFDFRDQRIYGKARQSDRSAWESPVIDPVTRMAMSSVGCPIHADDGTFMGVASVDIPISSVLGEANLKSRWQGDIEAFMVISFPREDREDGLLIIAQRSYDKGGRRHWMTGIEHEWLESDDQEGFRELLQLMSHKESGVVELPYKGTDSVWAFSDDVGFRFLLVTPKTVADQLPNAVVGSLSSFFSDLRDTAAIIGGVMLIITGLIAWFGSRTITRPLIAIAETAKRLAQGDFTARILMRTGDERDELIDVFNEMGPKLEEHLRISKDLDLAREVQKLLLPHSEPELEGFDLSGSISYCDQTGGDYYDFIELKHVEGRAVGVVLGDVSGHGVPAALVMATARGQLHSMAQVDMHPEDRISAINNFLSEDLDGTGRFLTMFYIRLTAGSSVIRWVRAGHDPAIRYNPHTDEFSELGGEGLPLGVMGGIKFQESEGSLQSGEVLLLATDGVWEARNSDGEMFGKKRPLAIVRDNAHKRAQEIRRAVMEAVEAFQANGQEDDIAVVVIKKS